MVKKERERGREREKKEKKRGEREREKKIALGRLLCQWRREISPRYPCLTTWSRVINTLLDSFLHARHSKSFVRCLWPRTASTSKREKRWIRILFEERTDLGIKIIENSFVLYGDSLLVGMEIWSEKLSNFAKLWNWILKERLVIL